MGAEPIYLLALVAEVKTARKRHRALVTDREELNLEDLSQPLERTNQGPLATGARRDVGSFFEIEQRARLRLGLDDPLTEIREMTLTVIAASGHAEHLVGCRQTFRTQGEEGQLSYVPTSLLARQIRRMPRRDLDALLRDEGAPNRERA
jgi:hypothetical protein